MDEERAFLITSLLEHAGATSFYDSTATKLSVDNWRICYWVVSLIPGVPDSQTCFETNPDPEVYIPPCPLTPYPRNILMRWVYMDGRTCPCVTDEVRTATWDPSIGQGGGWRASFTGCNAAPWVVTVEWQGAGSAGNVVWKMTTVGDGPGTLSVLTTCGDTNPFRNRPVTPNRCGGRTQVYLDIQPDPG